MIDLDCLSLVFTINNGMEAVFRRKKYPKENFNVYGLIPGVKERKLLESNKEYLEYVGVMIANGCEEVEVEVELLPLMLYTPTNQLN